MAAVCAALFAALVITVLAADGKRPLPGDRALHTWATAHRPDALAAAARALTDSGTGIWPYLLAALAGSLAGRNARDRTVSAVAALAVLLLGQGLRQALMPAIARPRPPRTDWATHASGFSMPSGHSTTSALVAGLACWAAAHGAQRILRWCVWVLAVLWAAGVGLTRIYLGVHWPSDVPDVVAVIAAAPEYVSLAEQRWVALVDHDAVGSEECDVVHWWRCEKELVGYIHDARSGRIIRADLHPGFLGYERRPRVITALPGMGWTACYPSTLLQVPPARTARCSPGWCTTTAPSPPRRRSRRLGLLQHRYPRLVPYRAAARTPTPNTKTS
ncbi:hypothetical protein Stube_67320 [Streptomyces tubercidicus]|uniref:Phosphatidic acid phosphatase type 2/haloperoxidase domain-containing protein n=1 Tax=Streptomyces tubercidicus TaxID=47759 RepID=A0A640V1K6_9ACTN|nr:hypothetical protein Stube_67320 [Streptomyces tubercidicus]